MARKANRSGRRSRSDTGKTLQGVVLGVIGVLLIGGLVGANFWIQSTTTKLDEANCPVDGPRGVHMIMIDRSDPITGQQGLRIKQMIDRIADESETGERFDFFVFEGDSKQVLNPTLSVCAPGRPEDASELYQNPEKIRKRYEEDFIMRVKSVVDELTSENELDSSPILESIRAASLWSFGKHSSGEVPLKLTLISDMIQNSALLSQYKGNVTFDDFQKSDEWLAARPPLKGASVDILYLLRGVTSPRAKAVQNRGHQLFWEQLVFASGGKLTGIDVF